MTSAVFAVQYEMAAGLLSNCQVCCRPPLQILIKIVFLRAGSSLHPDSNVSLFTRHFTAKSEFALAVKRVCPHEVLPKPISKASWAIMHASMYG